MRRSVSLLLLGLAFASFESTLGAMSGEYVVVSSTAAPEYKRRKGPDGTMPESYVFSPGKYFGGSVRDKTQEKTPFLSIAQMLAPALVRQKYLPAPDPALANLVIVVHWGSTETYEDAEKDLNNDRLNTELAAYISAIQESGMASAGALNSVLSDQEAAANRQEQYLNASAELLGYKRSLQKESANSVASEEEKTMRTELAEERYFVILMAYDYQLLKKEKKSKLLWVTRMSVRAPGNNFAQSIPGMARIAADFFGQQHDDLGREQTKLRDGQVNIGELKVVEPGVANPAKPAPPK